MSDLKLNKREKQLVALLIDTITTLFTSAQPMACTLIVRIPLIPAASIANSIFPKSIKANWPPLQMPDALDLLETLHGVNIAATAAETIEEKGEVMADLNAEQLAQGLRSDGTEILPDYAPLTVELKKEKSGLAAVTDHVTLYDTGSFYRQLVAEVQGDAIIYDSRDEKADDLDEKYSTAKGSIYGLTSN